MCGFGMDMIFKVAIFLIVIIAIIAMLRWAFPALFNFSAAPYGGLLQIVIGAVIAILILLFLWKMAECAGLMRGASLGSEAYVSGLTDG